MSIETDFRSTLAAYAPLSALVGARISKNAVDQEAPLPLVAFAVSHDPLRGFDGAVQVDIATFSVECWAKTAIEASNVADKVQDCFTAYNAAQTANIVTVITRASLYEGELKDNGEALTIEWTKP